MGRGREKGGRAEGFPTARFKSVGRANPARDGHGVSAGPLGAADLGGFSRLWGKNEQVGNTKHCWKFKAGSSFSSTCLLEHRSTFSCGRRACACRQLLFSQLSRRQVEKPMKMRVWSQVKLFLQGSPAQSFPSPLLGQLRRSQGRADAGRTRNLGATPGEGRSREGRGKIRELHPSTALFEGATRIPRPSPATRWHIHGGLTSLGCLWRENHPSRASLGDPPEMLTCR